MSEPTITLYTQVPDALIEAHGLIVAAVYGRIRRYAMLDARPDRACRRRYQEIADALGISTKTVTRAVATLEAAGLIRVRRHNGGVCLVALTGAIQFAERVDHGAVPIESEDTESQATTDSKSQVGTTADSVSQVTADSVSQRKERLPERQEETSFANAQEVAADAAAARLADTGAQGMTIVQAVEPPAPAANRQPTAIRALVDAFIEATGDTTTPYSRHVRVAKDLARAGRTPEDVTGCHRWIMADPGKRALLAGKPYTLTTLGKFMHAYLTDPVPLAHVQACYVAILTGLGLEADDLTTDIQGDYWSAARQAVTAGAEPSDVRAAVGAALTSNRANPNLPPSARMVAASLAGVRSRQRQAVTR